MLTSLVTAKSAISAMARRTYMLVGAESLTQRMLCRGELITNNRPCL